MDNLNTSSAHDWHGTQPPRSVSPLSDVPSEANLNQDAGYSGYVKVPGLQAGEMPTMPDHHKHKRMGGVLSIWWPEFLACFIILAAFGALVGTVVPFQDRPLPRWPYQLSINTLVSIYTIIFEMALMVIVASCLGQLKFLWFQEPRQLSDLEDFDQGAKGAWGALVLLWTLRARHTLASIGALLVVLSIFIAPFNQQLIRYYPCTVIETTARATIPRINMVSSTGGQHSGALLSDVALPAQAAINLGIYDDVPAKVTPFCPTGNCTFTSEYVSAGYCRQCEDWTEKTVTEGTGFFFNQNLTVPGWDIVSTGGQYAFVLGPNNVSSEYPGIRMMFGMTNETLREEADERCDGGIGGGNWTCLGFGAAECTISPCVRRYRASVREGDFSETVLSTWTDLATDSEGASGFYRSAVDMRCVNATEREYLSSRGYALEDDTEWLAYNLSQQIFTSSYNDSSNLRDACIYQGDQVDLNSLRAFFDSYFSGELGMGVGVTGVGTTIPGRAIFNLGNFNFTHLETKFDNMAVAMTAYARDRAGASGSSNTILANMSTPVLGEIQANESCVAVRWPWIALEAAVAVLGVLLLAVTVWMVQRSGDDTVRHDYKASVLPLLFHRLETDALEARLLGAGAGAASWTRSELSARARHIRVRLARNEKGWGFAEAAGGA